MACLRQLHRLLLRQTRSGACNGRRRDDILIGRQRGGGGLAMVVFAKFDGGSILCFEKGKIGITDDRSRCQNWILSDG